MTRMRTLAGLFIAIASTHSFAVVATVVGLQARRVPAKATNVLGPVASLEIVNKVVSPDGFPRP